jgi:PAS domain S-box-containing protein
MSNSNRSESPEKPYIPPSRNSSGKSKTNTEKDHTDNGADTSADPESQYRLFCNQWMSGYAIMVYRRLNDPEWTTLFISDWALHLTGYLPEDFVSGRVAYAAIIHPEDRETAWSVIRKAVSENRPFQMEYRIITAENEEKWVWEQGRPDAVRQDGTPVINGMIIDISDRKKLERQFIQAQKMEAVGRLSGGIAHDFNNYLTAVIGYSEMLAAELPRQGLPQEWLGEIIKAANNAAELTRQLLAFSRNQMLAMETFDVNTEIRGMRKMLQRLIGEDVRLSIHLENDLNKIRADRIQMQQVIMNLAVNARDAMPNGGELIIETANMMLDECYARDHGINLAPGAYVVISVSDTGCGMDPETKSRVFEPFFTTKTKDKGTGLGLSTVYGIIKQMDGYIWVYSEPEKGTTIKIELPAATETVPAGAAPKRKPLAVQADMKISETILLVEDDNMVRNLLARVLRQLGYHVFEAMDGRQALEIAGQYLKKIHLIVTDVVMPGMNGRELADAIQTKNPDIRVLFMSGYATSVIAHHGILDHGMFFIQKPISPKALARKIREVLKA